jgi:hypothetical protein
MGIGLEIFPASTARLKITKTYLHWIELLQYKRLPRYPTTQNGATYEYMYTVFWRKKRWPTTWMTEKDRKICRNARFLLAEELHKEAFFFCDGQAQTRATVSLLLWMARMKNRKQWCWFHKYFQCRLTRRYERIGGRCCIFWVFKGLPREKCGSYLLHEDMEQKRWKQRGHGMCNGNKMKGERLTWEWIRQVLMFVFGEE